VIIGHLGGLVIPKSWTGAVGITEGIYHCNALLWGTIAGVCTLVGILILIYRRRTTGRVFMATTKNDKAMYVVLVAAIVAGLLTTVFSVFGGHEEVTYRDTVSAWFRSLFYFSPKIDLMAAAPLAFQVHTLIGMLLFAIWPFTRLVHAFTVPLHYLFRPTSSTGAVTICPLRGLRRLTAAGPLSARVTAPQIPEMERTIRDQHGCE
jgi:nitrate reductase gamma subunit